MFAHGERPHAILLDLDDTILDDSGRVDACWRDACAAHASSAGCDPDTLRRAIDEQSKWFWGDPERHRTGRLELNAARRHVVALALASLGIQDDELAALVGDAYSRLRDERMEPLEEAIETVAWLRRESYRLALLTNGAGPAQRRKIDRFGLAEFFDAILVEGEVGFGKPDPRVYTMALDRLDVAAEHAVMIGDNLVWDVQQPKRMGMRAIWIDRHGTGRVAAGGLQPDYVVRALSDIRALAGEVTRE